MESNENIEVLTRAIEKLLDEKRKREAAGDAFIEDHDDQLLLSRLISQLVKNYDSSSDNEYPISFGWIIEACVSLFLFELLALTDVTSESPKTKGETDGTTKEEEKQSPESQGKCQRNRGLEESLEEIAKGIKKVKRQNTITHALLSAMIFLTLAWQLSEYSMIFMMKQRITHPIRSIGGMLNGMFKGKLRPIKNQLTGTSTSSEQDNNNGNGTNTGATLQMPELLREFGFDDDEG